MGDWADVKSPKPLDWLNVRGLSTGLVTGWEEVAVACGRISKNPPLEVGFAGGDVMLLGADGARWVEGEFRSAKGDGLVVCCKVVVEKLRPLNASFNPPTEDCWE